jgi:hypothetical protein
MAESVRATLKLSNVRHVNVPPPLLHHRLIAGRYFYTLPTELLEDIVDKVSPARFEPDVLNVDRELSKLNGDHSRTVGFHNATPIPYRLLGRPLEIAAFMQSTPLPQDLGWSPNGEKILGELSSRVDWFSSIARSYAGWLSINSQFVKEQAEFFQTWRDSITGTTPAAPAKKGAAAGTTLPVDPNIPFAHARDEWLRRWHLVGMAGPFLVTPAQPQLPVLAPDLIQHGAGLGVVMFYPSIFPLPDRGQFRAMIEGVMNRRSLPEHLQDWGKIIAADSGGKKHLARLQRVFLLQHYWRVIFSRHAAALKGQLEVVRAAFANFLRPVADVDESGDAKSEAIRKDLGYVAAARGSDDWYTRSSPYDNL